MNDFLVFAFGAVSGITALIVCLSLNTRNKADETEANAALDELDETIETLKAENALLMVVREKPTETEVAASLFGAQNTPLGKTVYWLAWSHQARHEAQAKGADGVDQARCVARAEAMESFLQDLRQRMLATVEKPKTGAKV